MSRQAILSVWWDWAIRKSAVYWRLCRRDEANSDTPRIVVAAAVVAVVSVGLKDSGDVG